MKIRKVLKEFEAHIYPVQLNSKTQVNLKGNTYEDESYRFNISARNIPLPDVSKVDVILDETHIP